MLLHSFMKFHGLNVLLLVLQVVLLNPIENPQLELAIVMLIVPFIVNVGIFLYFEL